MHVIEVHSQSEGSAVLRAGPTQLYMGGYWVDPAVGGTVPVHAPATGETIPYWADARPEGDARRRFASRSSR